MTWVADGGGSHRHPRHALRRSQGLRCSGNQSHFQQGLGEPIVSCSQFVDREHAGWMLVERLREFCWSETAGARPLVLAIPRGGVEVGAALAHGLAGDLDVVLARKLRARCQPELAIGAVAEGGEVTLNHFAEAMSEDGGAWIELERSRQFAEIVRRREMYRRVRPQAPITDRTVIVTDDGLATGATMIAALRTVRAAGPARVVVALPVAPADRLSAIEPMCDRIECLQKAHDFIAVGQFYRRFDEVTDERVVQLLRDFGLAASRWSEHPVCTTVTQPAVPPEQSKGAGHMVIESRS